MSSDPYGSHELVRINILIEERHHAWLAAEAQNRKGRVSMAEIVRTLLDNAMHPGNNWEGMGR